MFRSINLSRLSLLAALPLILAGCGSSSSPAPSSSGADTGPSSVAKRYVQAKSADTMCGLMTKPAQQELVAMAKGLKVKAATCVGVVQEMHVLNSSRGAIKVTITKAKVTGDKATVTYVLPDTTVAATDASGCKSSSTTGGGGTVDLVRQGGSWLVQDNHEYEANDGQGGCTAVPAPGAP
jgi:hypothetical protein